MSKSKSPHCLNCGHEINGANYCPNCGQINTHRRVPLRMILNDFFGDYFTFDSKFFHSLVPLLFKPGHLTHEYLAGRRVCYISPLRLYIFTTFLFFFIITVHAKFEKNRAANVKQQERVDIGSFDADSLRSILNLYAVSLTSAQQEQIINSVDSAYSLKRQTAEDTKGIRFTIAGKDVRSDTSHNFMARKARYLAGLGKEGSAVFWKEVLNQIPKVLFLLLPLFALLLKLLYIRRKMYFVEHLIFSLHFHTFIFVMLILTIFFPKWYVIVPIILIIFIYLFISMLKFYQQYWLKTIFKYVILLTGYLFLTIPAFVLLVILALISV